MAVLMTARGEPGRRFEPVVARVAETAEGASPPDTALLCRNARPPAGADVSAFAVVLVQGVEIEQRQGRLVYCESLEHLETGDLILVDGNSGRIRTLYRAGSAHNALFTTDRCNSNCIMCSQPPKPDAPDRLATCLRVAELLAAAPPEHLNITGGEPTLLGGGFIDLLAALKERLPETAITVLSNGRTLADPEFVRKIAVVKPKQFRFTIPLHADVPEKHNYIAQAKNAFSETLAGFYNLSACGIETEVRVVLHAQSVPRLEGLAEFIWRKLPFAFHVAFMGLEEMGYVKKNGEYLMIAPAEYMNDLASAVFHLYRRGMVVSIYNLPLCSMPRELWAFARQSISDHKQTFIAECASCDLNAHCAGFFTSSARRQVNSVRAISLN